MGKRKHKTCNGFPTIRPIDDTEYMRAYRAPDAGKALKEMGLLDEKTLKKRARILLFTWLFYFAWFIYAV